ncbi:MAG: hypothetical protein EOO06_02015 [Chitinophagaceae bacterium]|nr:MAG: hypothetical protein EOO06_02015 [Chitinophagaceae bacterium]
MKKLYLFISFALICFIANAQVFVSATAGNTGPSNYASLRAAAFSINNGVHQGDISITVIGAVVENIPTVLLQSGVGSAAYTSIAIRPGAGSAASITGDFISPVIDFSGADNITIDGLNTGGSSLVISNISLSATSSCIRFTDGATNNIIRNCILLSATPSATSATIVFGSSAAGGNSNNSILNNRIASASTGAPANAILSSGTAGQENANNTISDNFIYDNFQPGVLNTAILLSANNTGWTISNNRIYQTTGRVFTSGFIHRGISIVGGSGYNVNGNIIGNATETGTGIYTLSGTAVRFLAIDITAGVITPSNVQGNRIENIQLTSSAAGGAPQGIFTGIYIAGGDVNVGNISPNIVGSAIGNGSITIIPGAQSSVVTGITYNGGNNANIENNIVGSINMLPTGALSGNIFAVQLAGTGATINVRNNTLGGSSSNSISVGVKGTTTGNGLLRGVYGNNNGTITIANNTIQHFTHNSNNSLALFRGIECATGIQTIRGNIINNLETFGTANSVATQAGIGILVGTAALNLIIDSNTVSNLKATNATSTNNIVSGIYLTSNVTGARITRNRFFGFSNAATGVDPVAPPVVAGIYLRDLASGELFIANNMISLGTGETTNTAFIGIWNQVNPASGYSARLYYNSINIQGTVAAGGHPSFGYYRGNFTTTFTGPLVDIKNNIFSNERTGGTGGHYAIANSYGAAASASGWPANASNFNVLNAIPATVGYWNSNQAIQDWKESSASDVNSLSGVAISYVDPASDLHLVANANAAVEGKGTPIATVTADIDNQVRDLLLPDIGADEIFTLVPVRMAFFRGQKQASKNLLEWKASSSSASVQFIIERSTNGVNFEAIGSISASSFTQLFSFYDMAPVAGKNYYRLTMIEDDGSRSYSSSILLVADAPVFAAKVQPGLINNGMANLYIQSVRKGQLLVSITDAVGRQVLSKQLDVQPGSGTYPLYLPAAAKGVYYVVIKGKDWESTQRILVQ